MKKVLILFLLLTLLVSGCLKLDTGALNEHTVLNPPDPDWVNQDFTALPVEKVEEVIEEESPEVPAPDDASITISAVGDIAGSTENFQSVKSGEVYEFSSHFKELREMFMGHDYTIASLISPIAGADFGYSGYPRYNAPEELLQAVADIGIDAVSTANRFAFELGQRGLMSNLDNLRRIGFAPFGTATSEEEAAKPLLVEVGGIKLGLLSYTTMLNQSIANQPYAVAIADQTKILADLNTLRDQGAEIISVSMYWGDEYADMPNVNQMEWMSWLESQGVDIVLGAHPHVVQPLVIKKIDYQGQTKTVVQAYSLGNFYSAFLMDRTKTGLVLELDISRQNGQTSIQAVRHELVYNHQTDRGDGQMDYKIIDLATLEERSKDAQYKDMKAERDRIEKLLNALNQ